MVFQSLRSTVCNDLLVAFEQPWSEVKVFERGLSRVCGDFVIDLENVRLEMGAQALGRFFELWSVRVEGGTVWSCSNSISKERADAW